jgi:hypothetical protein
MIKAAISTISILFLIGAGSSLLAQPSSADIASAEAIRRQANIIELRRTLDDAARVQKQGELPAAALLYERALEIVRDVGVGVDRETKDAIAGLSTVRLQLAEKARRLGNLAEADAEVTRVLKVDPTNVTAQNLKKEITRAMEGSAARCRARKS